MNYPSVRSLAAVCLIGVALGACDLGRLQGAFSPGTAVIDLDEVARSLGRDKTLKEQIDSANEQLNKQVSELASGLQRRLEEERSRLQQAPGPASEAELRKLTSQAEAQLRKGQQEARQRAQLYQLELVNQFRSEVLPVAERIARERGARVVLIRTTVLWFDPQVDISAAVVEALRSAGAAGG